MQSYIVISTTLSLQGTTAPVQTLQHKLLVIQNKVIMVILNMGPRDHIENAEHILYIVYVMTSVLNTPSPFTPRPEMFIHMPQEVVIIVLECPRLTPLHLVLSTIIPLSNAMPYHTV